MQLGRISAGFMLLTLACAIGGCSGTFRANVANQSSHPVRVELVTTTMYGGIKVLGSERLAPGDAAVIGPVRGPRRWGRLFAYPEGIAAPRASADIGAGETTAHVVGVFLPQGVPGVDVRIVERNPN